MDGLKGWEVSRKPIAGGFSALESFVFSFVPFWRLGARGICIACISCCNSIFDSMYHVYVLGGCICTAGFANVLKTGLQVSSLYIYEESIAVYQQS